MTEESARDWIAATLHVPRETLDRIEVFIEFLRRENTSQNLIAASTLDQVWERHVLDSAQLLPLAPRTGSWLDLGTGAGFPGLIVAALGNHKVTLTESRRKRIDFLSEAVRILDIADRTEIVGARVEAMKPRRFDVISARAFAPLEKLLTIASRFADDRTIWVLPKGRGAHAELDAVRRTWQGAFRAEPSITDPQSAIIVADHVRPKEQP